MDEGKPKSNTGLVVASVILAGLIFAEAGKFSSNTIYALLLAIVAVGAGWIPWKSRFIKNSTFRWIVLALASAFVLGFTAGILNHPS